MRHRPGSADLDPFRLVQGAAGGTAIVIARAIARDLYEGASAARSFALLMQISGAAPTLAPLIGGEIIGVSSSLRALLGSLRDRPVNAQRHGIGPPLSVRLL